MTRLLSEAPTEVLFHIFDRPRPKILVVSHERSGTHFLMNSLARCYGYMVTPWLNFDSELGLNFHDASVVADFFEQFRNQNLANIVKSHHAASFFEPVLAAIVQHFHVFYIFRDPRDVMVSFWKFLNQLPWNEGPKTHTCGEFLRAEPVGAMTRYQTRQEKTPLHRWVSHVDGWTHAAAGLPAPLRSRITFVRFDELSRHYEDLMKSLSPIFGEPPAALDRPAVHENSILPGVGGIGTYHAVLSAEDLALVDAVAGPAMRRLNLADPVDVPDAFTAPAAPPIHSTG